MAAAVAVPPSPHHLFPSMATAGRRAPLASIPNATNSPHRFLSNSGSKRPRTQANLSHQENEHPTKRLAVDKHHAETGPTTPSRHTAEGRVFERGTGTSGSTAFQRKLVAARDRTGLRVTKNVEPTPKDDTIKQWQKHYRKLFPTFSFYFDGVSDDARARFVRQITSLGAQEEKFFSKAVTHIITTRHIPPEDPSAEEASETTQEDQPQTINPTLLDRHGRTTTASRGTAHLDILQRGRQMGMKLWAAEKLQRVLTSILDDGTGHGQSTRAATTTRGAQGDLSQALRNDKINAAERDQANILRDLVLFKGPYIYIHDIDEKYRPTMVREYKAARRGEGEWPQFRSVAAGKCPFVEDPAVKREMEQERARQRAQEQRIVERVMGNPAEPEAPAMQPPRRTSPRKVMREVPNPPPPATINPGLLNKKMDFFRPSGTMSNLPREPEASGIQRSNVTSAIQSNMISSTAATGVKASTNKELHELKRKVLERTNTGSLSVGSIPSSHRMNDLAGALKNARAPAPQRAAKSKAQEKLGGIQEEADPYYTEDATAERAARRKRRSAQRDPKPGYCENCRDKYEDFEEHIESRKHRKFATTASNWTDLDALLAKLQ